jgi:DNA adenine methylase
MLTLAPWKGGKARLVTRLLPLFPPHRCYVEPFGGMASLLLNKPTSEVEVYNDRDDRLVELFAVLKYHPQEFDRELDGLLTSRRLFELYRDRTGITDIQRAAQFLYALAFSFGGNAETFPTMKLKGHSIASVTVLRERAALVKQRLQTVTIEHLDWEQVIERYDGPDTFFFCDPPYMETSGYRVQFLDREQDALAARMRTIKGKFLMTNSDLPAVRQLYRGFPMTVLRGQLAIERSHGRALKHLTVTNYPLKRTR